MTQLDATYFVMCIWFYCEIQKRERVNGYEWHCDG